MPIGPTWHNISVTCQTAVNRQTWLIQFASLTTFPNTRFWLTYSKVHLQTNRHILSIMNCFPFYKVLTT